jgi:hypothetical protein
MLTQMVDESDPDNSAPQRYHAYQTAERCRELFPEHGACAVDCKHPPSKRASCSARTILLKNFSGLLTTSR